MIQPRAHLIFIFWFLVSAFRRGRFNVIRFASAEGVTLMDIGSRLGPYEILGALGAGGMGEVYRGRDTRLDRQVAIKVLPRHLSGNPDFKLRFEREARVISGLNHPHICVLHDVGEQEGVGFLVMELCEGESLADRVLKGPLPIDQVLQYGMQIADALDRAHRSGVVHRDLKPSNVMITRSGAKLLDFGLAKPGLTIGSGSHAPGTGGSSAFDGATEHRALTAEGSIVGTFQYMAPEQLEGEEADTRSDIFAFGCLLYEMATGKRAFEGKTKASLIASILDREPPPISQFQPLAPPALQRVIEVAMAKSPEDRWQSAHDLLLELRWISEAGSQAGVAAPVIVRRKRREAIAWLLAAAAVIAAVAIGVVLRSTMARANAPLAFNLAPNLGSTFVLAGDSSGSLTISPNGRYVTFAAKDAEGKTLLWIRGIDSTIARPINGTEGAIFPFWSPDSRFIAFFADSKLKKIDVAGGPPLSLAPVGNNPRSGGWNRDGVIIYSASSLSPIHKISASGGASEQITQLAEGETTHRWATFLPDGKHFLYFVGSHAATKDSETNAVYIGSLEGEKPRLLLHARSNVLYASGYLLYVRDRILLAHPFDARALKLKGDPIPLAEGVQYDSGFFRGSFSLSENGTLIYRTGSPEAKLRLEMLDRSGKVISQVGEPDHWGGMRFSPDGQSFVAQVRDATSGIEDLWIYDLERNIRTRFSFGGIGAFSPTWSPDGSQIAYASISKKVWDIAVRPSSGGGAEEIFYTSEVNKIPTSWSTDGQLLALSVLDPKTQKAGIWILPTTGEKKPYPFARSDFNASSLEFSPDGRWALYLSDESGKGEVYVAPFPGPGGKWQVSNGGAAFGLWRKGGREIVFGNQEKEVYAVDVSAEGMSMKIGTPKLLFKDQAIQFVEVSADGERFLVSRDTGTAAEAPVTIVTNWVRTIGK
ncbi:MAG TPA: protein kinase [Thermoanaerobaculia bacterium]|nr:protein kinase [Thermoanaerobaculia bacterium]